MIKTNEILNELKKSVFGQDDYLMELATTGYKHQLKTKLIENGKKPINSNLLVIGPSGCGKTFSVQLLSKIIGVPFYEVDCSSLVQTGYKGGQDIDKVLSGMVSALGKNSQNAIVYFDEFDKILDTYLLERYGDRTCQQNLLKVMEPNTIQVTRESSRSYTIPFETGGLTFIATGSFEGVKEKVRTSNIGKMGFNSDGNNIDDTKLTEQDLINNGYMPELIGRFAKTININQLNKDDFYNIVKNGSNSDLVSYKTVFDEQKIDLEIKDEVYKELAEKSYSKTVGARNIGKQLNLILDKCLSDISNDQTISKITIECKNGEFVPSYDHDPNRLNNLENMFNSQNVTLSDVRGAITAYVDNKEGTDLNYIVIDYIHGHFDSLFKNIDTIGTTSLCSMLKTDLLSLDDKIKFTKENEKYFSKEFIASHEVIVDIEKHLINLYSENKENKEAH